MVAARLRQSYRSQPAFSTPTSMTRAHSNPRTPGPTWIAASLTRDCCATATRTFASSPITAGAGVATGGLRRTISTSSAGTSEADWAVRAVRRDIQNTSIGRRHRISRALVAIHLVSNSYTTSRNIAIAFSANCRRGATWGSEWPFRGN